MWDGDPIRVDARRPLVGFALVTLLCSALIALSLGAGPAILDLVHAGKPIAAPSSTRDMGTGVRTDDVTAEDPAGTGLPAELQARPLGVSVDDPAGGTSAGTDTGDTTTAGAVSEGESCPSESVWHTADPRVVRATRALRCVKGAPATGKPPHAPLKQTS